MTAEAATKPTLLLVDDTPSNIDVLRGILSAQYTLKIATSGERALEIAGQNPQPDLILLDIMMPGTINGLEVCSRIKSSYELLHTLVILLTARGSAEDRKAGILAGADEYLVKPFSTLKLLETIESLQRID